MAVRPALRSVLDTQQEGVQLRKLLQGITGADGKVSIAGFGSLLSLASSLRTFPDLTDFRVGQVSGYRRVFSHAATFVEQMGLGNPVTREQASMSCEECPGVTMRVSLFEAFVHREHEYYFATVLPEELTQRPRRPAVVCRCWNDEAYRRDRCSPELWERKYAQYGLSRAYRDDLLPCRAYLRFCVLAAAKLGPDVHSNFLDTTFLGDRTTSMRAYLGQHPDIMEQPAPGLEVLKDP